MSLAIKFGVSNDTNQLSGFIYFDVVRTYTKSLTGSVTKHPVDSGASITDHYISNNPTISIDGVISYIDFSDIPYLIDVNGEKPLNAQQTPDVVSVSDIGGGLQQYLQSAASEFFPSTSNSVTVSDVTRVNYSDRIYSLIEQLMSGIVYDQSTKKNRNQMTTIELYEFDGYNITKQWNDLVMTAFTVNESQETGDSMAFSMTLEKVRFVTSEKTSIPSGIGGSSGTNVKPAVKNAASKKSKKGKMDCTVKTQGNKAEATSTDPGPGATTTASDKMAEARSNVESIQQRINN